MAGSYSGIGAGAPPLKEDAYEQVPRWGYVRQTRRVKPSAATRLRYGETFKVASAAQKANRKADRYTGFGRYRRRRKRRRRYRGMGAYGAAPLYRGQGGFWSDAVAKDGWLRKGGLDLMQTGLGNVPVIGGFLRDGFGAIRKVTGIGDYNIASNVLVEGNPNGRMPGTFEAPSFTEITDTGGIVISHREFIGNIYGPSQGVGFELQKYKINPGIEKTFPWLSQIAANYQDYSIKQLIFSFKSTVSNFQTTTGVTGTVLSVTQHDPYAKEFEDKSEIMQSFGSVSCKATDNQVAGVECDPTKLTGDPIRHVRTAGLPDTRDPKEYDWGEFVFALSDFPDELANANIGEIWVSYTVELLRPRVFTGLGNAITTCRHYMLPDSSFTGKELAPIPGFSSGNAVVPNTTGGTNATIVGQTYLWDESLTNNVFVNSQNSLDVLVEGGTTDAHSVLLGGHVRICPLPFTPAAGSTEKQLGASFGQTPLSWLLQSTNPGQNIQQAPIRQGAGFIKITFPSSFAGKVRIVYKQMLQSTDGNSCGFDANCEGNVEGVYDIVSPYSQGSNHSTSVETGTPAANTAVCFTAHHQSWTAIRQTVATNWPFDLPNPPDYPICEVTCELHCEVSAVTGGVNNSVTIRGCIGVNQQINPITRGACPVMQCSLEISEYNASMTDKKDVPTIVNQQTGQALVQDRSDLFD